MPNSHNIDIHSDMWPKRGEKLKYICESFVAPHEYYFDNPSMTCGEFYEVKDIRLIPCKDQIMISDDTLKWFWVDLNKFNFMDDV